MDGACGNARQYRRLPGERASVEAHPHHAVVLSGREVGENRLTRCGDAEQASFTARSDASHAAGLIDHPGRRHVLDGAAVAFGDQRAAVGQERNAPWHIEVGGDVCGTRCVRLASRFDVICAGNHQHQGRGSRHHRSLDARTHSQVSCHPDRVPANRPEAIASASHVTTFALGPRSADERTPVPDCLRYRGAGGTVTLVSAGDLGRSVG